MTCKQLPAASLFHSFGHSSNAVVGSVGKCNVWPGLLVGRRRLIAITGPHPMVMLQIESGHPSRYELYYVLQLPSKFRSSISVEDRDRILSAPRKATFLLVGTRSGEIRRDKMHLTLRPALAQLTGERPPGSGYTSSSRSEAITSSGSFGPNSKHQLGKGKEK
jgi:hypothetical protein